MVGAGCRGDMSRGRARSQEAFPQCHGLLGREQHKPLSLPLTHHHWGLGPPRKVWNQLDGDYLNNSKKYIAKISWKQVAILIPEIGTWNSYLNCFIISLPCWVIRYETCRYHIIQDGLLWSKKKSRPIKKQQIPNTAVRINCMHKFKAKFQCTLASRVHLGTQESDLLWECDIVIHSLLT